MGPRIEPCGTPDVTDKGLDVAPIVVTPCGIDCAGTILAMLAGSLQNHTDVASLGVLRGFLCQKLFTCPDKLYLLVLLYPALHQFGLELQQAALHRAVQPRSHADMR